MRRRRAQRGAETLEFTAVVGLVGLVLVVAVRALGFVEMQLRAQDDARTLARDAAVCERAGAALLASSVDPEASETTAQPSASVVAVTVTLPAVEIMPDVAATRLVPRATVTMRKEPGCP